MEDSFGFETSTQILIDENVAIFGERFEMREIALSEASRVFHTVFSIAE